jgi:hypothetical protein
MPSISLPSTGSTKKDLVETALEACGVADYTAEDSASILRKLRMMMAEHPFSALDYYEGDGALEELSGFSAQWDQAVSLSLAQRISPKEMNGQPMSGEAKAQLARSMSLLHAFAAAIPTAIMVSAPAGAGNRARYGFGPFIHES